MVFQSYLPDVIEASPWGVEIVRAWENMTAAVVVVSVADRWWEYSAGFG